MLYPREAFNFQATATMFALALWEFDPEINYMGQKEQDDFVVYYETQHTPS